MSTLFSPGRSAKEKERAEFPGEVEAAETEGVAREEFVVFRPLFPGDLEKVRTLRAEAEAHGFAFDSSSGIFRRLPKSR